MATYHFPYVRSFNLFISNCPMKPWQTENLLLQLTKHDSTSVVSSADNGIAVKTQQESHTAAERSAQKHHDHLLHRCHHDDTITAFPAKPSISPDLWPVRLWSCDCETQGSCRPVKTAELTGDIMVACVPIGFDCGRSFCRWCQTDLSLDVSVQAAARHVIDGHLRCFFSLFICT